MREIKIVICGLGKVGKEFIQLLANRGDDIESRYGRRFIIQAAVDIGGAAIANGFGSLPAAALIGHLRRGGRVEEFNGCGRPGMTGTEAISTTGSNVLIEMTPTNLIDGEPGTRHIFTALDQGMEVVSANKGPLVLFYKELHEKAKNKNCGIHISAASAAALPTLDVGSVSLTGTSILSIEGILNGTTNYILSRMTEEGCSYETALREA